MGPFRELELHRQIAHRLRNRFSEYTIATRQYHLLRWKPLLLQSVLNHGLIVSISTWGYTPSDEARFLRAAEQFNFRDAAFDQTYGCGLPLWVMSDDGTAIASSCQW